MITPENVADRLGLPSPTPESTTWKQWEIFINQAIRLIDRYQSGRNLPDPDPADVDYVVLEVVAAMARRPDDATTVDVSVDDGRVSRTYATSAGRIVLDPWWDYLWPPAALTSNAFTITPYYQP